jgi:uncharacterized membrane protein
MQLKTSPVKGEKMEGQIENERTLEWDFSIPLYNRFIALDCLKGFGIPFFIIASFFAWSIYSQKEHGGSISLYGLNYALMFIGILILLTMLLLWIIYQNRFESHFVIDSKGVGVAYQGTTSKKNKAVNTLLVVLGTLAKKPGSVGTGLISQSMQSMSVEWSEIFKVHAFPRSHAIALRNNWRQVMVVYCTKEVYNQALEMINQEVEKRKTDRVKDLKSIRKEHIFSWILTPFVLLFGFFLSNTYDGTYIGFFMCMVGGWVLLTVWAPTWIKKLTASIGLILTTTYWIWGLLTIQNNFYSTDASVRFIFLSLGCFGLIFVQILCFRRKE